MITAFDKSHYGLPLPTLGGKQFWRDEFLHAEWRIQQNVLTGTARLLDPRDRCWTLGSYDKCKARFDVLRSEMGIAPTSGHLVLLVHGIARSTGTFRLLTPALRAAGYDAAAISYPSTRSTIETHADGIATLLERLEGTHTVSFVTHSMGALIIRRLLAEKRDWQTHLAVGRIVLIAPPNQGADLARRLKSFTPYKLLYGPAGQQLVPNAVHRLPDLDGHEFAIIAGGGRNGRGFNPLLAGDDDGTVTVAETALPGAHATALVFNRHTTIANHPATVSATTTFIEDGQFPETETNWRTS